MEHSYTPSDDTLRNYYLGKLTDDEARRVEAWLTSNPHEGERLSDLEVSDLLLATLRSLLPGTGPSRPIPLTTAELMPDPVPGELGDYRIEREIGRGGMGVVLEAVNRHIAGAPVAIKTLHPQHATIAAYRERFLREAQITCGLRHRNIIEILHFGLSADGIPYYVMPKLAGESLRERLKKGPRLSIDECRSIGGQMGTALAVAHEMRLVHRDVTPGNIWLEAGTGRVVLLDFGITKIPDLFQSGPDAVERHTIAGTPHYMAPEVIVDTRADLFSTGVVLYEMATGQRPFAGGGEYARWAIQNEPPAHRPEELNPDLPPDLAALIWQLLEKEPDKRPKSAAEVVQRLAAPRRSLPRAPVAVVACVLLAGLCAAPFVSAPRVGVAPDALAAKSAEPTGPGPRSVPDLAAPQTVGPRAPALAPPPRAGNPNRTAARTVLALGGGFRKDDTFGTTKLITTASDMPNDSFDLTCIVLDNKRLTDEALKPFEGLCQELRALGLANNRITDTGAAYFAAAKYLTHLYLYNNSGVTDAGIARFKDCNELLDVGFGGTALTDEGLKTIAGWSQLQRVTVTNTRVTKEGVESLHRALPGCKIYWNGGVIH